jgi:uncharacterized surface protein with fasciclin (FAS1) repeats
MVYLKFSYGSFLKCVQIIGIVLFATSNLHFVANAQEVTKPNSEVPTNRFIRWRVNNGLVFAIDGEAVFGSSVMLKSNNPDTDMMKWKYENSQIYGVNELCLGSNNNQVVLKDCNDNNTSWEFDERGRMIGITMHSDRVSFGCVQGDPYNTNGLTLQLTNCNTELTQLFEIEGTNATKSISQIETEVFDQVTKKIESDVADPESKTEKNTNQNNSSTTEKNESSTTVSNSSDTANNDNSASSNQSNTSGDTQALPEIEDEIDIPETETTQPEQDTNNVVDTIVDPMPSPSTPENTNNTNSDISKEGSTTVDNEVSTDTATDDTENENETTTEPDSNNNSQSNTTTPEIEDELVSDVIEENGLTTLYENLEAAGLLAVLDTTPDITIFAPTNEAFNKLDPETLALITDPENEDLLEDILLYHVVPETLQSSDLATVKTAATIQGEDISFGENGIINDSATIINPDNVSEAAVIHTIDSILLNDDLTQKIEIVKNSVVENSAEVTSVPKTNLISTVAGARNVSIPNTVRTITQPKVEPKTIDTKTVPSTTDNSEKTVTPIVDNSQQTTTSNAQNPVTVVTTHISNSTTSPTTPTTNAVNSVSPEAEYTIEIINPNKGTIIKQNQLLEAKLNDYENSEYDMYWQLNKQEKQLMQSWEKENNEEIKRAFIDLDDWNWNESGQQTITFSAFMKNKNIANATVEVKK